MNYRFTGHDARFYPEIRDLEGKSLMAVTGTVFDFEGLPPSDGLWVPVEEPAQEAPKAIEEAPEAPPAPVAPEPVPEPSAPSPEAALAVAPEPPAPAPAAPSPTVPVGQPTPFSFPGFAPPAQPYSR